MSIKYNKQLVNIPQGCDWLGVKIGMKLIYKIFTPIFTPNQTHSNNKILSKKNITLCHDNTTTNVVFGHTILGHGFNYQRPRLHCGGLRL